MSVGAAHMIEMIRGLVDSSPQTRDRVADSVTDVINLFDVGEAATIAQVLLWLAVNEPDDIAREAEFNAVAELAESALVPSSVLATLTLISREELTGSSIEHYDYLASLTVPRDQG